MAGRSEFDFRIELLMRAEPNDSKYGRGDLNPHVLRTLDPKSSASANSATPAFVTSRVGYMVSRLDDNHCDSSIWD